jgi:hypothetical protein
METVKGMAMVTLADLVVSRLSALKSYQQPVKEQRPATTNKHKEHKQFA